MSLPLLSRFVVGLRGKCVIKMYPVKLIRGRRAARAAAVAFALASVATTRHILADDMFAITSGTGIWTAAGNWSNGVPGNLTVVDIYHGSTANYNISSAANAPDFGPVQIAGGTSVTSATLSLSSTFGSPYFEAAGLYLGTSYTGQNKSTIGSGPGKVVQSAGSIQLDPGGQLAVDPTSTFTLSGSGQIVAYNEQLGGTFTQSGASSNSLVSPSSLVNFGVYTLSGGTVGTDSLNNAVSFNMSAGVTYTGAFTQSGGTVQGSAVNPIGTFTNSGNYVYSAGTFNSVMTNNVGATISINTVSIPFTNGVVNNGRMTVTGANASSGAFAGSISGTTGTLLFNGNNSTNTLTGSSSFSGQTTIASGTLVLAGPLGIPVGSAGAISGGVLNGGVTVSSGATLQTNTDTQIATTSLVTVNGGLFNLNGHNESIGSLSMTAGQITQSSGLGLGVATGQVNIGKGSSTITGGLQSNSLFTFNIASTGTLDVVGNISGYNSTATGLLMTGGGGLTLSAGSNLSSIEVQQGIVQLSEGGNFDNANNLITVDSVGTFSIGSQSVAVGNIAGTGAIFLGTGQLSVYNSSGGSFAGTINGTGSLTKLGAGNLSISGTDSASGTTNVNAGSLTVTSTGSIASYSVNVAAGASATFIGTLVNLPSVSAVGTVTFAANPGSGVLLRNISALTVGSNATAGNGVVSIQQTAHTNRTLLYAASVTLTGATGAWTSSVDLADNDLAVQNGSLANLTNQIKSGFAGGSWTGAGITSSAAAADTTHLTALGVIINDDGLGNPLYSSASNLGLFDGTSPGVTDVLVKYTYYGDANLDGKIDGSDYSRIDSTFAQEAFVNGVATNPIGGWYNGDFDYSGVVNGSDYTLIDNAFNSQAGNLSTTDQISPVAAVTSEIAGVSTVPEPTSIAIISLGSAVLGRRRRR